MKMVKILSLLLLLTGAIRASEAVPTVLAGDSFKTGKAALVTSAAAPASAIGLVVPAGAPTPKDDFEDILALVAQEVCGLVPKAKSVVQPKAKDDRILDVDTQPLYEALCVACRGDSVENVKKCADQLGGRVHYRRKLCLIYREKQTSPLMEAVSGGNPEIVKFLLERGASVNEQIGFDTALCHVNSKRPTFVEVVKLLMRYGARLEHSDGRGSTVFMKAASDSDTNPNYLAVLLGLGADITATIKCDADRHCFDKRHTIYSMLSCPGFQLSEEQQSKLRYIFDSYRRHLKKDAVAISYQIDEALGHTPYFSTPILSLITFFVCGDPLAEQYPLAVLEGEEPSHLQAIKNYRMWRAREKADAMAVVKV